MTTEPAPPRAGTLVSAHPDAAAWVAHSVARYGGRERWQRLWLKLAPSGLTGLLPRLKGVGHTFNLPPLVDIQPARAVAIFRDYPGRDGAGVFAAGRVALGPCPGDAPSSLVDYPLADHRATFRGVRKWRRWSPLDALYFFGYALTHYHAVPFTLADAELRAWDARRRILTVAFPPTVHTHCAVQSFHFDDSGLILRHDYVAEIVGGWARGAHFWHEYRDVDGFPVATHRRVLARIGSRPFPLVALDAHLGVAGFWLE